MLIRFTIENFLSFGERTELSMIPGMIRSHPDQKISLSNRRDIDILKLGIIYGANASGKTNLIKALTFMKEIVTVGIAPGKNIPFIPNKLCPVKKIKPSRFEIEFRKNNNSYAYGFEITEEKIIEEWLFKIDKKKDDAVFERKLISEDQYEFTFNKNLFISKKESDFLDFIALGTRKNQLFLYECIDHEVAGKIYNSKPLIDSISWFRDNLVLIFPDSKFTGLHFELESNEEFSESLCKYLNYFDTGIDKVELEEVEFDEIRTFPDNVKNEIARDIKPGSKYLITDSQNNTYSFSKINNGLISVRKVTVKHQIRETGEYVYFNLNQESDGTRRLIDLLPAIIDISKSEKVFIIDELDRSLHPALSKKFVELFITNALGRESQLVVTTHESGLLDLEKFRKDSIMFIEKDKDNQSVIYSLNDFNIRFDKRIRNDYLHGRFGAVPLIPQTF